MEKVLRSRLNEFFDLDTRVDLAIIADDERYKMSALKKEAIINVFRKHNVNCITDMNIGPGTNRCAFRIGEYILKVATDHDGCIDNLKEFQMCPKLMPYVTMTYEVSENGSLLIAEYARVFQSEKEMNVYYQQIKAILEEISKRYFIGDIGLSARNYSNWGLRRGTNEPVCLDYAYVYNASSNVMKCTSCGSPLFPSSDFNDLICRNPECGGNRKYKFTEIRTRIGNTFRAHNIDHMGDEAYAMDIPTKLTTLDGVRSPYLKPEKRDEKEPEEENEEFEEEEMGEIVINLENAMFYSAEEFEQKLKSETVESPTCECECHQEEAPTCPAPEEKAEASQAVQNTEKKEELPILELVDEEPQELPTLELVEEPKEDVKEESPECVITEKVSPVYVPPQPEEPENDLAFSGSLEEDEYLMDGIPETLTDPNLEDFEVDYGSYVDPNSLMPNPNFVNQEENHIYEAVSKLSNLIIKDFKTDDGYELVIPYVKGEYNKDTFYGTIQNAIFCSLAKFMKFKKIENRDINGNVQTKRWEQPDINDVMGDQLDTLMFLNSFWENNFVRPSDDSGIQADWLNFFTERLNEKIEIEQPGIDSLVNWMLDNWISAEQEIIEEEIVEVDPEVIQNIGISMIHHPDYHELRIDCVDDIDESRISMPFYIDINQVHPGSVQEPNNEFEWLKHFSPLQYFKTRVYDDFTKAKKIGSMEAQSILFSKEEDMYLGGSYIIDYAVEVTVDDVGNVIDSKDLFKDRQSLQRLNALVDGTLKNTDISGLDLNLIRARAIEDPTGDERKFIEYEHVDKCSCGHHHEHVTPVQQSPTLELVEEEVQSAPVEVKAPEPVQPDPQPMSTSCELTPVTRKSRKNRGK